jgi:hypothetical protein
MLGNSWVTAHLVASQEGLSSMELVLILPVYYASKSLVFLICNSWSNSSASTSYSFTPQKEPWCNQMGNWIWLRAALDVLGNRLIEIDPFCVSVRHGLCLLYQNFLGSSVLRNIRNTAHSHLTQLTQNRISVIYELPWMPEITKWHTSMLLSWTKPRLSNYFAKMTLLWRKV